MWFNNLLEKHFEVLVAYMAYKVSFGKVGGKNNPIKAFRRRVYGYRNADYISPEVFYFSFILL